jgi:HTH-type transcriptional regulator, sugar sensing transcriptional regulator
MDINEKLKRIGFTGNESKVYLTLVKKGEMSANRIAKSLGMDRTLTYTVLNHLIEKGQINYVIKEKKKFFSCNNPDNIMNPIKAKEYLVYEIIDEIKSIKKNVIQEIEISIHEGREAVRNIYHLMKSHKEILAFGATGRSYDFLYEAPALTKELEKIGLHGRIITSKKYSNHPMTKVKGFRTRFVEYDSEATTSIFGEFVLVHIIKENPIFVKIKSKDIANTYRNHFEVLWKGAKE